jgi:calcium-dependent protein kinase
LDINGDGAISKQELTLGYKPVYGDMAEYIVEKLFKQIDLDGSGEIDYSEWVMATINKEQLLTPEKLSQAFQMFDNDGGGTISADEFKEVLF